MARAVAEARTPRGYGRRFGALLAGVSLLAIWPTMAAAADAQVEELIVTAQKREEAINSVPMSITALSGDSLAERGVVQTADLARVVPGFTYTESRVGTPIYTLRGVGFADIALGGRPTVSVYQDEAPIPFTIETRGGALDLARLEVLKGPQGTLYGQNSTGGAINLVSARPTRTFAAGVDLEAGNFDAFRVGGFLSGPIGETLTARLAFQQQQNGGWQKNYRTGEDMAALNLTSARLLLDWTPSDRLRVDLNLNGFIDRSESQAPQLVSIHNAASPAAALIPGLIGYPLPQNPDNRDADWTPGDYHRDNSFIQANVRVDYDITDKLTLTSMTSYSAYDQDQLQDVDGQTLKGLEQRTFGKIHSFYQEVRIAGDLSDRVYFVLGANYASDRTREENFDDISGSTQAFTFVALNPLRFNAFEMRNNQDIKTYAAFGNLEFKVTDALKLYGGARYTRSVNDFQGCTGDIGDGQTAAIFTTFSNFKRALGGLPPIPAIARGGCVTADALSVPQLIVSELDEDNVSWRAGFDWKFGDGSLAYANISRGYKAGGYPTLGATATAQYDPTLQEKVTSYEAGLKVALPGALQLNGAIYHYDYRDKQVLGIVQDPSFGRLLRLINVPKSKVDGAEAQLGWAPVAGLNVNASVAYVDSKIRGSFISSNPLGVDQDFGGEPFPNTPKWQYQLDASYQWAVNDRFDAVVGASASHQGGTNTELGQFVELRKKAYTLVDLRAGVESHDGDWRLMGWIRNVGDTAYWTSAARSIDVYDRYMGMPRTYGLTLTYRYQ
ncbi:TonB-dependent receptor [Phenylobacterium sp.]|uniref:TonB-dependent receptor n=1 Tax=Phenylobacterium sp. TaxID=1871053 RepID=UPI0025E089FE|nr:TonB-dependent receptor [Phenylobacterium sp.]MBX3485797.1 TonB-dependent receptor [Phenylobacterium sp.]MCW5758919.1 TonB-dependent receptor [Phenylobacterium sp.]